LYFTPFDKMFTYLNVPDNIGKESLFEAELERCYSYYQTVKNSANNYKVIGYIDELFTGTNYLEGMSGSYAIIKKISECVDAITIVSTHFHEICDIPNIEYCKFYANVKKEDELKHGESIYDFTYKIQNGISDQCIALNLLKERGYGNDIIDIALKKLTESLLDKKPEN
jgi:DNA mismatch repair protein MutS